MNEPIDLAVAKPKRKVPISRTPPTFNLYGTSRPWAVARTVQKRMSAGIKVVEHCLGEWFRRSAESVCAHARRLPGEQASDGFHQSKKVRFLLPGDGSGAPEFEVHHDTGACREYMAVPSEGSGKVISECGYTYPLSREGGELLRSDFDSLVSQRSLYCGGYRSEECIRHSRAANPQVKTTDLTTNIEAWCVDIHSPFRMEVSLLAWSNWDREDTLGFRPVRKAAVGAPHGGFEVVFARPARWDSLRRHLAATVLATGADPSIGLGVTFDSERETWQYYHPSMYKEDIYFESALRGRYPTCSSGDNGSSDAEDIDHQCHGEDVHSGQRCPLLGGITDEQLAAIPDPGQRPRADAIDLTLSESGDSDAETEQP